VADDRVGVQAGFLFGDDGMSGVGQKMAAVVDANFREWRIRDAVDYGCGGWLGGRLLRASREGSRDSKRRHCAQEKERREGSRL